MTSFSVWADPRREAHGFDRNPEDNPKARTPTTEMTPV